MSDEDRLVAAGRRGALDETARDGSPYRLRLVAHDREAYDRFYNVVSNGTLWFVQHYLWGLAEAPDLVRASPSLAEGYAPVNRAFADAVLVELEREGDAAVCFHDYHLYLAPGYVRKARPEAVLTHFIHIPWAEADYWHALPDEVRRAVHEGMLANDVVGFHTDRWRRNFVRSCEELVGAESDSEHAIVRFAGRETHVGTHPISIDPEEFDALRHDGNVLAEEQEIADSRPELLVVRVDRTDPSKNIVRGFRAFAMLLDNHPELRGRVGMLAFLTVPAAPARIRRVPRSDRARGSQPSTAASSGTVGGRSTFASPTTFRRRWPRTSSSTCCS